MGISRIGRTMYAAGLTALAGLAMAGMGCSRDSAAGRNSSSLSVPRSVGNSWEGACRFLLAEASSQYPKGSVLEDADAYCAKIREANPGRKTPGEATIAFDGNYWTPSLLVSLSPFTFYGTYPKCIIDQKPIPSASAPAIASASNSAPVPIASVSAPVPTVSAVKSSAGKGQGTVAPPVTTGGVRPPI